MLQSISAGACLCVCPTNLTVSITWEPKETSKNVPFGKVVQHSSKYTLELKAFDQILRTIYECKRDNWQTKKHFSQQGCFFIFIPKNGKISANIFNSNQKKAFL